MKKPWGLIDHPWLPAPPIGEGFMGGPYQNKSKKSRSETFSSPSYKGIIEHKRPYLSRENLTFYENPFNIAEIYLRLNIEQKRWLEKNGSPGPEILVLWLTLMRERQLLPNGYFSIQRRHTAWER